MNYLDGDDLTQAFHVHYFYTPLLFWRPRRCLCGAEELSYDEVEALIKVKGRIRASRSEINDVETQRWCYDGELLLGEFIDGHS